MESYSIRDIARLAGSSVGTVSRVLNHAENVDEALKRRILDVVAQVGYQSGPRGRRSTRVGASSPARIRNIAVLAPGMVSAWKQNDLWAGYMTGIEQACQERRFRISLHMGDQPPLETLRDITLHADGILLKMSDPLPDYVRQLLALLPCVGFGAEPTGDPLPQVVIDNTLGGALATRELLARGHRRIAFINHEPGNGIFVARSNGYLEAMKSAGRFRAEYLIELPRQERGGLIQPEATPPDLGRELARLLALPEPPTAVVVANDWGAYGLLTNCRTHGVRVPEDLSVVGMDDTGNLCLVLHPALSSVAMPFDRTSYFAGCTLCDLIDGIGTHQRNVSSVIRLPGEFHPRTSIQNIQPIQS